MNKDISESRAYFEFVNSISSSQTKRVYIQGFNRFMRFCELFSVDELLRIDIERAIIDYVISLKESRLSHNTIHVLLAPIYHFCDMADVAVNKKRIRKYQGERNRVVKDRAYTHEEISKLLNVADIRIKAIVLLMASSGVRVGSIPILQLKHLQRLKEVYKITVYENTNEEYVTFCSPECVKFIEDYLEFRIRNGEVLGPESYLIRKQFNILNVEQVKNSDNSLSLPTLRGLIDSTAIRAGLRQVDRKSTRKVRKQVALTHAFRKFFTSQLINSKVNPEIREMLLGHSIGLASSYYRPTEEEMLIEYSKSVDALTIDPSNRLKREVKQLESKQNEIELMRLKHEKEMEVMNKKLNNIISIIQQNPKAAYVKPQVLVEKMQEHKV